MAKLPYLFLPSPGGKWTDVKDLVLKGKNILFFWGSFSAESKQEFIKLNNDDEIKSSICAISLDIYDFKRMNRFLSDNNISIPCLLDNMLTTVRLLNITKVPYYLKVADNLEITAGGEALASLTEHKFTSDYTPREYELELQEMINQLGRGNNERAEQILHKAYQKSGLELIKQNIEDRM